MEPLFCKIDKNQICIYYGLIQGKKGPKNMVLGAFILQTSKSSSNELKKKQVSCESSGNTVQNRWKPAFWPISALFEVEKNP